MLDILEWLLDELGLKFVRLDGRYENVPINYLSCDKVMKFFSELLLSVHKLQKDKIL